MRRKKDTASVMSLALRVEVWAAAVITAGVLMGIIACILYNGIPGIVSEELFSVGDSADKASLMPAMVNTAIMTGMSLGMALPMGVCAAVYLAEYSGKERIGVKIIRLTAETLAGIPSIVYGLFGYMLFVITLRWGYSLLSGAATLAVMILPLIMRTTEDALLSVPQAYREGSMGLGAGDYSRCHPGCRKNSRGIGGADFYSRDGKPDCKRSVQFNKNPFSSYVCFAYGRNL